jgi:septum formation protein
MSAPASATHSPPAASGPGTSALHFPRPLVLGSTSPYRRELLGRLQHPFDVLAPQVDETPLAGETPEALAGRLALAKAQAVARLRPEAVVIGSDQVADLDGQALGKPGNHERAVAQLRAMRGRTVIFQTALAVVCQASGFKATELARVEVRFRDLTDAEIEAYLRAEQPYDCAGSAKAEGLGISLLEAIVSDDPTALIGLPLIRTCRLLRQAGLSLPMTSAPPHPSSSLASGDPL